MKLASWGLWFIVLIYTTKQQCFCYLVIVKFLFCEGLKACGYHVKQNKLSMSEGGGRESVKCHYVIERA